MKKAIPVLVIVVLYLIIVSASLAAEWTVMVYCAADNNLDLAGVEDLNELEYSGSTDSVNFIFLLDRYGWDDTKLYYVLHDSLGTPSGSDMNIISQDISSTAPWLASEEDMSNPQTLQDFVIWTIQNYPANHYLLSIWDHGNGIFMAGGGGITKGECWDDHGADPYAYIDLEELRDVLAAAYAANGNQKIDIVGHDVCNLGQIETHYQMKDYVKIGIASEEGEPWDGWEYGYPFYDLVNSPLMSPDRLAQKIVQYYSQRYGTYTWATQAAVNLSALESALIPKLNTFSELLTSYMYEFQSGIKSARTGAEYYNWDCGRNPELYHFAQLISDNTGLPDTLRTAAQDLLSCYPSVVIAEYHGNESPNAHGMTIWFPDDFLSNYCRDDYMTKINFIQEYWDEFLAEFDEPHVPYTGPVWHVSTTGNDSTGDGSSTWPFRTIQKGINQASSGDTVLVASGHYYERINFKGKGILVSGKDYLRTKAFRNDSTIIDADTTILGVSDTGSVVVFVSGENSSSILEGFILQNGIGTSDGLSNRFGGGVYCFNSSPTLRDNLIRENSATFGGGIDCNQFSSPEVSSNRIESNTASSGGGGISCRESSSPDISYNIIRYNSSGSGGGILCDMNCVANIFHNIIDQNSASSVGAGIMCDWNASPAITNNIVCSSPDGEGIHALDEAWPTVSYNNVWNNADGDFYGGQPGLGDTTWGTNFNHIVCDSFFNILRDPMFDDVENYTLLCISPCIDAGDSSFEVPDSGGRRIDIGIYEYPYVIGDANSNGEVNISDVVYIANCIFSFSVCPCPLGAGDANCNSYVEVSDVVYLINYLFRNGPEPGCY